MRLLVLLLSALLATAARGGEEVPDVAAGLQDRPRLARLWIEARLLERDGFELEGEDPERAIQLYQGAAQLFEQVAHARPDLSAAYWRSARSYWMAGETLAIEAKERKGNYFERAEGLANRGIEVDPECAECMLWKFIAMGRLRTTRGLWIGVRQLPHMAELLDRGTHRRAVSPVAGTLFLVLAYSLFSGLGISHLSSTSSQSCCIRPRRRGARDREAGS